MPQTKVRLHSLDALRGLAALAVVLWHWQHFQLLGTSKLTWSTLAPPLDHSHQPFFLALSLFYEHGYMAVDLFFLISGFIFFWLYAERIADQSVTLVDFWMLRITRLYPLHVVTLLLVAGLQLLFYRQNGQYFVYPENDLHHFLLSLAFFQLNGDDAAFNGPTWSITIELIMYGVFCVAAWFGLLRHSVTPLLLFVCGLALYSGHRNIAVGICGFFEGGLLYYAFLRVQRSAFRREVFFAITSVCLFAWGLIVVRDYIHIEVPTSFLNVTLPFNEILLELCVSYILFPLTIMFFAMHENMTSVEYRRAAWLGKISYSSYLLHFPLQIAFALMITSGILPYSVRTSAVFMLCYGAILVAVSLVVFSRFEAPVQTMLRQAWRRFVQLPHFRKLALLNWRMKSARDRASAHSPEFEPETCTEEDVVASSGNR